MILYITFSGKDFVQLNDVDPSSGSAREIGQYNYEGQSDTVHSFLELLLLALKANNLQLDDITGIIIQWGSESRFTVSRLTGVIANTVAMTRELPIIAQATDESIESALLRLEKITTTAIPIEYSAEPRLG